MTVNARETQERIVLLDGTRVHSVSFRVGKMYSCHVDNIDPGNVIGRALMPDRQEAEEKALANAKAALAMLNVRERLASVTAQLRRTQDDVRTLDEPPPPKK